MNSSPATVERCTFFNGQDASPAQSFWQASFKPLRIANAACDSEAIVIQNDAICHAKKILRVSVDAFRRAHMDTGSERVAVQARASRQYKRSRRSKHSRLSENRMYIERFLSAYRR